MEQNKASSVAVKPMRRRLSTAHARRRARAYTNPIKQELLHEESADELGGSQEYSLGNGSAAFLKGFPSETEGLVSGISDRYETQREVRKKSDFCRNCNNYHKIPKISPSMYKRPSKSYFAIHAISYW